LAEKEKATTTTTDVEPLGIVRRAAQNLTMHDAVRAFDEIFSNGETADKLH